MQEVAEAIGFVTLSYDTAVWPLQDCVNTWTWFISKVKSWRAQILEINLLVSLLHPQRIELVSEQFIVIAVNTKMI